MFRSKKDKFAILLSNITTNIRESADYFADFKITNVSDLKVFAETMKAYEHTGDDYAHEMFQELNTTFITPIEREDLLMLTMALDEVIDGLEHVSGLREMFSLLEFDEYELQFIAEIKESTKLIDEAIDQLINKKLIKIRDLTILIKDSETKCDVVYRSAVKALFNSETNPIRIMKLKETYETLENVSDSCQTVANVLDTIVMKNA